MDTLRFREADHPFIASLLAPLDRHLRRRQAIFEFSTNPHCIFRVQELHLDQAFILSDGTSCLPGSLVLDLHLWNEHIPHLDTHALRWARQMSECLDFSLRELAQYLKWRSDLADVLAIRANMGFGTPQQTAQLVRISGRYGFEPIAVPKMRSLGEHMHRFGENILISFIVLAWNKAALRPDSLWRDRTQVFLSRAVLDQRYGGDLSRHVPHPCDRNMRAS
ncbi:MAG TPA: hypothetical protein VL996_11470 [Methylocella sp.]|nr:hypothetical protein [Methylocella sp.]